MKTLIDFQKAVAEKYGVGKILVTGHKKAYFDEAAIGFAKYCEEQICKTQGVLIPHKFDKNRTEKLGYGKYLVIRKDGKIHFETWNGTGWAYNNNSIDTYYLPKIEE